jgi:hypothetical protein
MDGDLCHFEIGGQLQMPVFGKWRLGAGWTT